MTTSLFDDPKDLETANAEILALKQEIQTMREMMRRDDNPQAQPLSYYQQLRKDDPQAYNDKQTQYAMDRDSQALGAAFFDVGPAVGSRAYQTYTGPNAIYADPTKAERYYTRS
jgi:hypothetical protein